jgi:hypothetical protein
MIDALPKEVLMKLLSRTLLLVMTLETLALAQNLGQWLVPKSHFLYSNDTQPLRVYFQKNADFSLQKLEIKGLQVKNWAFVTVFQTTWLQFTLLLKPGADQEFDHLQITDQKGILHSVFVGLNRVMSFKPSPTDDLGFERLESLPTQGVFLAAQLFNQTDLGQQPQELTILGIEYAPKALSGRVLLEPYFDPRWFEWLYEWSSLHLNNQNPESNPLPRGVRFENSGVLNVKIKPSFGVSIAVLKPSKTRFPCSSQAYWQVLIKYRLGNGGVRYYPVPIESPISACPISSHLPWFEGQIGEI